MLPKKMVSKKTESTIKRSNFGKQYRKRDIPKETKDTKCSNKLRAEATCFEIMVKKAEARGVPFKLGYSKSMRICSLSVGGTFIGVLEYSDFELLSRYIEIEIKD